MTEHSQISRKISRDHIIRR